MVDQLAIPRFSHEFEEEFRLVSTILVGKSFVRVSVTGGRALVLRVLSMERSAIGWIQRQALNHQANM